MSTKSQIAVLQRKVANIEDRLDRKPPSVMLQTWLVGMGVKPRHVTDFFWDNLNVPATIEATQVAYKAWKKTKKEAK